MLFDHRSLFSSLLLLLLTAICSCSQQPLYLPPTLSGSDVSVDVASLRNEVPIFFTYRTNNKNVNFFVLRLNGKILSFFDACITCYPKKQGYRNEEAGVACRACNMHFSIYKLEKGIGGCYPIKLEGRTDKGKYLISIAALEKMSDKF
jgi:uncharacterized membrane protein